MITQEVTAWNTAMKLIAEGLRPPIVHAATGVSRNRLRSLYQALHGKPAAQGRVPEYAYNRIKTKNQVIEATAFYQIYHQHGGDQIFRALDHNLVIEVYQAYKAISSNRIDFTSAWYIARDLRENVLTPKRCRTCERMYLYDPRSDQMTRCPLCGA
jgi:hypothetical protein